MRLLLISASLLAVLTVVCAHDATAFGVATSAPPTVIRMGAAVDPKGASAFDPSALIMLLVQGQNTAISRVFIDKLEYLNQNTFTAQPDELTNYLESFMQTFFFFMCNPMYDVTGADALKLIEYNDVIANVAALTHWQTTDVPLKIVLNSGFNNAAKLLILYNPRNALQMDYDHIRTTVPTLFAHWYLSWYSMAFSALCEDLVYRNLVNHQKYLNSVSPNKLVFLEVSNILALYFASTYIDADTERIAREHVKAAVTTYQRTKLPADLYVFRNQPNRRSVAIVTGHWGEKKTIVHRVYNRYLISLAKDYDLTLIQTNIPVAEQVPNPPTGSIFKRYLYTAYYSDHSIDMQTFRENDFALAFFLDIGLNMQSIHLAYIRIAPIQVTGYGHPVSTFGGEIDYFIGSALAELPDKAMVHYSERLVLLPGLGVVHSDTWSQYAITTPFDIQSMISFSTVLANHQPVPNELVIICPWHGQKINAVLLQWLQRVVENAQRPIVFRFFLGSGLSTRNRFLVMHRVLENALYPARVQAYYGGMPESQYLSLMNTGDMFVDALPFGGVNTVMDALYLHKPFVCIQGDRWISRVACAHLRRIGMLELIATSGDQYIQIILRLINDDQFRMHMQQRMNAVNVNEKFYYNGEEQEMNAAIKYLIDNHDRLKQDKLKTPVYIT